MNGCGGGGSSIANNSTGASEPLSEGGGETAGGGTGQVTVPAAKNILFAHGYRSDKETWNTFAKYIKKHHKKWHIYRYDVKGDASIKVRATALAKRLNTQKEIKSNTLVAVGHSMGGLDLRYIVSMGYKNRKNPNNIFYKAAKKIKQLYTLATPHKGTELIVGVDDATKDMSEEKMREFNSVHPYHQMIVDGKRIPFLAYRFKCDEAALSNGKGSASDEGNDGTVMVKNQILNGAPFTQSVFSSKHFDAALCLKDYDLELENTTILESILKNKKEYQDSKDIVFYEHNDCAGDEKGAFSTTYKAGGVNCSTDSRCDDNKISSIRLYPSIKKNTIIALYSNRSDTTTDDWAQIKVGSALKRSVCINSFETELSDEAKENHISLQYHEVSWGEDGLDGKVSYIKIEE